MDNINYQKLLRRILKDNGKTLNVPIQKWQTETLLNTFAKLQNDLKDIDSQFLSIEKLTKLIKKAFIGLGKVSYLLANPPENRSKNGQTVLCINSGYIVTAFINRPKDENTPFSLELYIWKAPTEKRE